MCSDTCRGVPTYVIPRVTKATRDPSPIPPKQTQMEGRKNRWRFCFHFAFWCCDVGHPNLTRESLPTDWPPCKKRSHRRFDLLVDRILRLFVRNSITAPFKNNAFASSWTTWMDGHLDRQIKLDAMNKLNQAYRTSCKNAATKTISEWPVRYILVSGNVDDNQVR